MKGLKPYPKYKDSGVRWLGKVPEHWEVKRLKSSIASSQNGVWGDEPNGVDDVFCIRVADFDRDQLSVDLSDLTVRAISYEDKERRCLEKGDLLLEKSGGGEKQPVGAVMLWSQNIQAVCSNFIADVKVALGWESKFLVYLHSHLYSSYVNVRSIKQTTGIQNLDSKAYFNELISAPETSEQKAIVSFLDCETARIDSVIEKKRRLIELLKEKRTSLITQAVTKGLDPNVPMKDSGVEWLGEIPAHWDLKRLRYVCKVNPVKSQVKLSQNEEVTYLPMEKLGVDGSLDLDETKPLSEVYKGYTYFADGDVIIAKITHCFENGKGALVSNLTNGVGFGTTELHVLRQYPELIREYLYYLIQSDLFMKLGELEMKGAAAKIVKYLELALDKIDILSWKTIETIEKLQEYRSALISAAITGKIDVRSQVLIMGDINANQN